MSQLTVVERVEHALRTERDRLRETGNLSAANAINNYLQEADTDSKTLLFNIIQKAPDFPATAGSPEEGPVVVVLTEVRVDWEKIINAFVGVCETDACTYWLSSFHPNADKDSLGLAESCKEAREPWYSTLDFWGKGGQAYLTYDNPDALHTQISKTIGESEIISGLNAMANKCPTHFADLVADNDDAITHDVMIQCILFGDIIYG